MRGSALGVVCDCYQSFVVTAGEVLPCQQNIMANSSSRDATFICKGPVVKVPSIFTLEQQRTDKLLHNSKGYFSE